MKRVTEKQINMALDSLKPFIDGLRVSYGESRCWVHNGTDIVFAGSKREVFNFLEGVGNLIYVTTRTKGDE